jgi:glycosyltransferase involved in cell wall biosynthesis
MTEHRRLLHVFSSFEIGGSQSRFCQLVNALGDRYRHSVIALDGRTDARSRLRPDIPVEIIPFDHHKRGAALDLWRFRSTLAKLRPHLLLTYNWGAIEWALVNLMRPICPHVGVVDGFGPEETAASLPRRSLVRRVVYGRARSLVTPSRTLERLARHDWHVPESVTRYIPNGVNIERFLSPPDLAMLERFGLSLGETLIGTIAGLRPEKNIARLLDAFAQVTAQGRAVRLVIIGDGAQRAALESHAAALGIAKSVIFTGALDRPETLLGAITIYALSSDTEQMPISLVEAMAAGLPVASVDVGDVTDMVATENKAFVKGRDAESLAASLRLLLDDSEKRRRLGQANQEAARKRFSEESMIAAYNRLFAGHFD